MNASQNIRNESLIQPLQERGRVDPDRRALVFLHDDGNEKTVSTFEFHRQACRYSELLQEMGLEKGDFNHSGPATLAGFIVRFLGIALSWFDSVYFPISDRKIRSRNLEIKSP